MAGNEGVDVSGIEATAQRLGLSAHNVKSIILHVARQSAGLMLGTNGEGLSMIGTRASRRRGGTAKVRALLPPAINLRTQCLLTDVATQRGKGGAGPAAGESTDEDDDEDYQCSVRCQNPVCPLP
jgi:hypothetical protein